MNTSSLHIPSLTKVNKILLIVLGVLFIINSAAINFGNFNLLTWFGLSFEGMMSGHIFQLITYPFIPRGLLEFLFDGMVIWFIGCDLEDKWGMKRYLTFLLTVTLGAALFYLVVSPLSSVGYVVLGGPSVWALSLCLCFGVIFPERIMYFLFFPVKAKFFVMILIGISLYNGFFSPNGILAWGQIGAFISAWLWMIYESKGKGPKGPTRRRPKNSHLQLVEKEESDKKKITYH